MLRIDNVDIESIPLNTVGNVALVGDILGRYEGYVLIDLYTDIMLTIYKAHLQELCGVEFTDEDATNMALPVLSKKIIYKSSSIIPKKMPLAYAERIAHDIALISALGEEGSYMKVDTKELKLIIPNMQAARYPMSEKACIDNINLRSKLHKLGLAEYSKEVITRLLGPEAYESLGKENASYYEDLSTIASENMLKFNLTWKKPSAKELIKAHQKRTR